MPEEKKKAKTLHVDTLHIHAKDIVFHRDEEEEGVETEAQSAPFPQAPRGFQGPQAAQGPQARQGFGGPQGFPGQQGFPGAQGFGGPQGFGGFNGPQAPLAQEGEEEAEAPENTQGQQNQFPQIQRDIWGFPMWQPQQQQQPFTGQQVEENVVEENVSETEVAEGEQEVAQGPAVPPQPGFPQGPQQQGPFGWI